MNFAQMWQITAPEIITTLYMVFVTAIISILLGLPLGIILTITRGDGIAPSPIIYNALDWVVNIFRSVPYIILILLVMPLARLIVGKSYGPQAAILSLTIATIPFFARLMEGYFLDMNKGLIEAAKAMGSNNFQIVSKVMIPETMPLVINGITMTVINIVGYSAMVGVLGAGGLGSIAYRYGYQRNEYGILVLSVLLIILIVQIVQFLGNTFSNKINKK